MELFYHKITSLIVFQNVIVLHNELIAALYKMYKYLTNFLAIPWLDFDIIILYTRIRTLLEYKMW